MAGETSPLLRSSEDVEAPRPNYDAVADNNENGRDEVTEEDELTLMQLLKIIFPAFLGVFLAAMDQTIVTSSFASIGSDLQQLQNTSWIAAGYMLTLTSFQPLYGKLSDIFGRKACLLFAYIVFAIGSLFCGLARSMTELVAARILAGIGGGGMTTVVSILVSDLVPLRSRGTWQGYLSIIYSAGAVTGAPLGGILADNIGWRWVFLIQVPALLVAILLVSINLNIASKDISDLTVKMRRVDFTGAFLLVIAVFTLLYGLDRVGNVSMDDPITIGLLAASAITWVLFGVVEINIAEEPFAPRRIVANPSLVASNLCNFFVLALFMCIIFHLALYVQAAAGRKASEAGIALIPSLITSVIGSLSCGIIMQRTGKYYWLTVGCFILLVIGTTVVALATGAVLDSILVAVIGVSIISFASNAGATTTLIALIANAGSEDQAIATAVSYLFRSAGSVVGLSVGSALVQSGLRSQLRHNLADYGDIDINELVARVRSSLDVIDELEPTLRAIVRISFREALQRAFWFAVILSGCCLFTSFFIAEKPLASRRVRSS